MLRGIQIGHPFVVAGTYNNMQCERCDLTESVFIDDRCPVDVDTLREERSGTDDTLE